MRRVFTRGVTCAPTSHNIVRSVALPHFPHLYASWATTAAMTSSMLTTSMCFHRKRRSPAMNKKNPAARTVSISDGTSASVEVPSLNTLVTFDDRKEVIRLQYRPTSAESTSRKTPQPQAASPAPIPQYSTIEVPYPWAHDVSTSSQVFGQRIVAFDPVSFGAVTGVTLERNPDKPPADKPKKTLVMQKRTKKGRKTTTTTTIRGITSQDGAPTEELVQQRIFYESGKIHVVWKPVVAGTQETQATSSEKSLMQPQQSVIPLTAIERLIRAELEQARTAATTKSSIKTPLSLEDVISTQLAAGRSGEVKVPWGATMFNIEQTHVKDILSDLMGKRGTVVENIEKYGCCLVSDPSIKNVPLKRGLGDGSARKIDERLNARMKAVEKVVSSLFNVLRNTHYGMFSSWKPADMHTASATGTTKIAMLGRPMAGIDGNQAHMDVAYSNCFLELHTDGTYFRDVPKLHCFANIHSAKVTKGGETTLADGLMMANLMKQCYPKEFEQLKKVPVHCRYCKEAVQYMCARPVFQVLKQCPDTNAITDVTISFNNSDRMAAMLSKELPDSSHMRKFYDAYFKLHSLIHRGNSATVSSLDPRSVSSDALKHTGHIRVQLEPGQILLLDNTRVLHGREAFSGPRVMCGAYVGSDDYHNVLLYERMKANRAYYLYR